MQQDLVVERLGDVVVGSLGEAFDLVRFFGLGRHHDDRRVARLLTGPQFPAHGQAVGPRQHDVQQDQIREVGLGFAQPLHAVVGHQRFISFAVEVPREGLHQTAFVFDDQDSWRGHAISLVSLGSI